MDKTTLAPEWWDLMDCESIVLDHCAVCGAYGYTEQHHVVRRSQGELYRNGRRVPKPTVTLCSAGGNILGDGRRMYCHGMAHHNMLHFEGKDGQMYALATRQPTRRSAALLMDGWRPIENE